jgi:hypothetical protein
LERTIKIISYVGLLQTGLIILQIFLYSRLFNILSEFSLILTQFSTILVQLGKLV